MMAATLLVAAATLVALSLATAVLSAADASVRLLSRARTRRLIEAERRGAVALDALVERPSRLSGACALWRALAYSTGVATLAWTYQELSHGASGAAGVFVAAVATVLLLFTLAETLPRTLAVHSPEKVGLAVAATAARLVAVLWPVARALSAGWVWLVSLVTEESRPDVWLTGEEYLPEPGEVAEAEKESAQEAFLDAVVDFATTIVREVMVPRTDMVCLEDSASVSEAIETIGASGLSRLPVYHETLDDIRGVLYAKDLLVCMGRDACPATVGQIAREAYFVPETKPVDELLVELRQRKTHIAIVADEYGGTAGLVTIEDLLEEIVGEIFDEYDRAEPMVVELGDGTLLVDGRLPIDDLNDLLGTAIELEADSIAGLFVELAGHIPAPGEAVEVEGLRITAKEVEGTRIRRLVVEPGSQTREGTADAQEHHAD